MTSALRSEEQAAVTMLLQAGKTIKEIAKFADLETTAVTAVARSLDLTPATEAQKRGKALYGSDVGLTFQEVAAKLADEGFTADDGSVMHHLTVASWVRNYGWAWGGADDGDYAPERSAAGAARSRYTLRLSKQLDAEVNNQKAIAEAAEAAWTQLDGDQTRIVQLAIIRGAAAAGVTDLSGVKQQLLSKYGDAIRSAKA